MRKIKVWAGEHPDELAALACVDSLVADPVPNVSPGIANPLARLLGKRFIDINMANAFPGNPSSSKYEERRTVEVLEESKGFDVVVNLHNMNGFGENFAAIDSTQGVSPVVLGCLGSLGLRTLVLTNYGGIQRYAHNAFALETIADGLGSDIEKLHATFDSLANDPTPAIASADEFRWFALLHSPHIDQLHPDDLSERARRKLHSFEPLPEALAARLGYGEMPVHAICGRDSPNEYGYWAELVTPIAIPDTSLWPK